MTWKEFKTAVEQQGVLDTDELWSIDFYANVDDTERNVLVYKDEEGVAISDQRSPEIE